MQNSLLTWATRFSLLVVAFAASIATLYPKSMSIRFVLYNNSDKAIHVVTTFLLTWLALIAFPKIGARIIFLTMAAISIAVEIVQLLGPRSLEFWDLIASWAGIVAVAGVYYVLIPRVKRDTDDQVPRK